MAAAARFPPDAVAVRGTKSIARTLTSAAHDETAINSKYDPQTLEANKDYTMTAPLFPDGSNFPCKVSEPAVPARATVFRLHTCREGSH